MTEREREPRIGLLGGTFNPIHLGHLRAAEEVYEVLALDQILFIPSRIPPHKGRDGDDQIVPAEARLAWVEDAIASTDHFSIDRSEIDREGPSYLVDTLIAYRDRNPGTDAPVFIVGEDAFAEMGDWRAPAEIFGLTDVAVMTRPPGQLEKLEQRIPDIVRSAFVFDPDGRHAIHREAGTSIELVSITALDISSSKIRNACREGSSIRFLVPESIREAIESSGEYGPRAHDRGRGGSEAR
jgi:nicotinate-nucleotide adenylyltransferase